nr:probable magnesium transporter NIPA2 [Ipomoea batatas]
MIRFWRIFILVGTLLVGWDVNDALLAHFILDERLHIFGVVGCILCLVGSVSIVLHAPLERKMESVKEVWHLATQPGFIIYTCLVVCLVLLLIFRFVPRYGQSHLIVYIGICSLTGSLTVMGVKAVGIALKLSVEDSNQFKYFQTWFFTVCVIIFCLLQLNYLNKDWDHQTVTQIVTEFCGFITILSGTFLLHKTKDMGGGTKASTVTPDSETTREAPPKSRPEGPEDV